MKSVVGIDLGMVRLFEGKCGKCKYVNVCGGCRAQSFLKHGKINGSETGCFYDYG